MRLSFRLAVNQRGREKRRTQRSNGAPPEIPAEVMEEILTRLPPKSLMRFKCVSKLWSSLISSQYFTNRFHTQSPRLFMCYNNSVILSLAPHTSTPSSFVVEDHLTHLIIPSKKTIHINYVTQNLSGFISYTYLKKIGIYNPTTRQLINLPAIKYYFMPVKPSDWFTCSTYCFGHDPVTDHYKVLCSVSHTLLSKERETMRLVERVSEYWIFVLKPRGSWKKVAPPPMEFFHCQGLSIDGVIYYMCWIGKGMVLVSFDIRSEEFMKTLIPVPHENGDINITHLIEYGGKVTGLDYSHLNVNGMVDLWVLEDAKNEEWSRKTLVVTGTSQSGKVIFIPSLDLPSPFYILCYDLHLNDMRKIEIKGIPDNNARCVDIMFMDQSESIIYLET